MNAFVGMGNMGNASIAAVAPGISESLATTAIGLIVAIPASIAYNHVKKRIQNEIIMLNNFSLEVLGNIERKFLTRIKSRA
jgi:biopolymer transport protein TolQ